MKRSRWPLIAAIFAPLTVFVALVPAFVSAARSARTLISSPPWSVDEAAASLLKHADYYTFAWEHRLDWERV